MTRKDVPQPDQYSFRFFGNNETRSLISVQLPGAELLATRIRNDKLWPHDGKKPNGTLISWYSSGDSHIAFDASTLEIHPHSEEKRFTVVAISTPELTGLTDRHSEELGKAATTLRRHGVLYVLERAGGDTNPVWRMDALDDVGLVEKSVVHLPGNFLLWRGRVHKEHINHVIDVIDTWKNSDVAWKRTRLHDTAVQVAQRYRADNYRVVSWKEIETRLHASKSVKADIDALKDGRGVVIEATCGCQWSISLKGGKTRTLRCGTPNCDGISVSPDKQAQKNTPAVHMYGHEIISDKLCGLCPNPTPLIEDSRIIKKLSHGRLYITFETRCPHHGLVKGPARNIAIDADQFKR